MPSTYYVSTSGSNSNSGTSSSPFNTIPYAITQASNSDTIIVISGTYTYGTTTSNNVININKELTIIGRETITETRPIINISTASQNTAVLCNASNITLKGLEFVHNPVTTGSNDTCINLAPGGTGISPDSGVMVNENINILDCKIHFTKFGLSSKAKYFSVKNCELVSKVVTTARSIAIYSQDGIVDILNNTFTSSVSNNGIELLHNNFATNDSYQNKRNGTVNFIGNITVGINITRRAIFFEAGTDTGLSSDRYSFNVSNNTISTRSDCMMLLQPNSNFLNFINLITLNNNTYNNNLSTSNNGLVKVDQTYAPNKGPLTTPINNPKFLIYSNTINNATLNLSASSYNVDDKNVLIFIGFSPDSTGGLATSVINSILNTLDPNVADPQPAPVITSITTSSQTATINFTQGSNTGASAITSYQYSTNGGSTWVTALETSTPIVVTGLTNGTTYSFIIRNNNSLYSEASNIVNATILSIPQPAPVITSITTSSQTATINFTQTTIVASAILSYQYSTNGGSDWVTALQTSSPIIVTGLTNGTRYNFVIRNNNGLYSEASNTFEATVDTVSTAELRGTGELTPDFINSIIGITSSFVIQKGFTSISENTFAACVGDVNITLPSSVTNIGSTNIQGDGIKIERTNGIPEWRNNSSSRPTQLFSNTGSLITANTLFA
jgi:hypothetical protein